jgi:hypothetical protein
MSEPSEGSQDASIRGQGSRWFRILLLIGSSAHVLDLARACPGRPAWWRTPAGSGSATGASFLRDGAVLAVLEIGPRGGIYD